MLTFLQGLLIGVGKILPGISGSLIAISFGIYDKLIEIISKLKIKQNIVFLSKLGTGIIIGIMCGSKVMRFFLNNYYSFSISIIIGILLYMNFNIYKREKPISKKNWLYIFVPFILIIIINSINNNISISDKWSYLLVIGLGFIDALTMIIPGISGTAIFMMLGVYQFILTILSNIVNEYIIFFGIGLFIGIIITSKIVDYLLKKYHQKFYLVVLGLSLSSLVSVIKLANSSINIIFVIIGFLFGLFFNHD